MGADDELRRAAPASDEEAARARAAVAAKLFGGSPDTPDKPAVAAPSKPAQPTQVGRYRIDGRLGAGGMGVVYTAHDPELDRMVAVKLLRHPTDENDGSQAQELARRRLLREARAMARLAHPNVIHVYDVGSFGEQVFVAMELVDGVDLAKWLDREPRTIDQILDCYLLAGEGLCAAHDAGLVHRDFKPENVLVGRDGRVRVLDFGLARSAEATAAVPKPAAKSPDAIDTGAVTAASGLPARPQPNVDNEHDSTNAPDTSAATMISPADANRASNPKRSETAKPPLDVSAPTVISGDNAPGDSTSKPSETSKPPPKAPAYRPALTSFTRTGAVLGTPRYMSPEQVLGRPADARSDQFSFCVAVYEAAYQQTAFPSSGLHAYLDDIVEGNLRTPPDGTEAPSWLWPILSRGLATSPEDRYPSMRTLLVALERGRTVPISPPAASNRGNMGLVAVATMAVVGALAWGLRNQQQPPAPIVQKVSSAPAKQPDPLPQTEPSARGEETSEAHATTTGNPPAPTGESGLTSAAVTTGTDEQVQPKPPVKALPASSHKRDWCAMHEDRYELLARTKRRKATVEDRRGQCYRCRKETRASRIRRFQPDDCAHYQVCHRVDNEACQ